MKIGVVVGKFQTPYLTEAHQHLFDKAIEENDQLVIFVLDKHIEFTDNNPLPYRIREDMLLQNFWGESNGRISIYPLQEQKYASVLQHNLDSTLLSHWSASHEFTLYSGADGVGSFYDGLCKVEICEFQSRKKSKQLRSYAFDKEDYEKEIAQGMIHAVGHKPPLCYNYVVSIVRARDGLITIKYPDTKYLSFPTIELNSEHNSIIEASFSHITTLVPGASLTQGSHLHSIKVDDWRFRDSEDFCFYHAVYHKLEGGNLSNVEIMRDLTTIDEFETEYHSILTLLNVYNGTT